MSHSPSFLSRRAVVFGASSLVLASPTIVRAQSVRNVSSFRTHNWEDHFDRLGQGVILADTTSRMVKHWDADGVLRLYPSSVPLSEDLTRLGYTEVVEKRVAPSWAPTPAMRERNPEWPAFIPGGDPRNPMGSHALYLSWQYYRIHGTQDTRKIGRKSSNGCIGLYNEHIEDLYARTAVGTRVKLI